MIGEVLEGYELTSKLGDGGTGETYLGVHRESGQKAAVKVLFAELCSNASVLSSFLADVKTASRVNHIGIADLYASGVHQSGRAFLIMELLEGKTLTDALIDQGSVSDMESFADLGWQLATLLEAVHGTGIIHGALKPDGIFMTFPPEQGGRAVVKLLDFGTAKFSLNVRHSQTGSLLGAPLYMSPEASRGLPNLDRRADVYSLGCILYEMACGRPPFVREGKGELIIAHATETPPSVSSLEPAIPQAIDTLIGRMLTKNPHTRPASMAEVASVIERFVKRPPQTASPPASPAPVLPAPLAGPPISPFPVAESPTASKQASSGSLPATLLVPRPSQQQQNPTALLPPDSRSGMAIQHTWIARVHQTTIIEPTRTDTPQPVSRKQRATPRRTDQARRAPSPAPPRPAGSFNRLAASVNLPIVILSASIVLAVGAAILILRSREPEPVHEARVPLLERRTSDEGFSRAALAVPTSSRLSPTRPSPLHLPAVSSRQPAANSTEPTSHTKPPQTRRDNPRQRRPAKRW